MFPSSSAARAPAILVSSKRWHWGRGAASRSRLRGLPVFVESIINVVALTVKAWKDMREAGRRGRAKATKKAPSHWGCRFSFRARFREREESITQNARRVKGSPKRLKHEKCRPSRLFCHTNLDGRRTLSCRRDPPCAIRVSQLPQNFLLSRASKKGKRSKKRNNAGRG